MSEPSPVPPGSRRERLRDATMAEIKATARRHLVASGAEAMFADMLRANGIALGFTELLTDPGRSAP